jgi:uridine kinase
MASPPSPAFSFVVGIAGGTGSGKTTVASRMVEALPPGASVLIEHDGYYRDRSARSPADRALINNDHPEAMETELLVAHLDELRAGRSVQVPQYDFRQHVRKPEPRTVPAAPVIIVEGILVLADEQLRARMDLRVFVDTDSDIRLMRRIARDMEERGRTFPQISEQYHRTVRPMHLEFVEPSKRFADLIIPEGGENRAALDVLIGGIRRSLG